LALSDVGIKSGSGSETRSDSASGLDAGIRSDSDSDAGTRSDSDTGIKSGLGSELRSVSGSNLDAGVRSDSNPNASVRSNSDLNILVVSTAIEESIPDVARARQLNIPIRKRADVLAELLNESYGIAVAGTSGKSTVTGMIGHVLTHAGWDPTIINGGAMKNFPLAGRSNNMHIGSSKVMVAESDESDGSIVNYHPALSVITNISKDHKDIPELQKLFQTFVDQTKEKVAINGDCPNIAALNLDPARTITFSLKENSASLKHDSACSLKEGSLCEGFLCEDSTREDSIYEDPICEGFLCEGFLYKADCLHLEPFGSTFQCRGQLFHLQVPGLHNIYNALATIAIASQLGIPMASIQEGLDSFQGISRRFDLIGEICVGEGFVGEVCAGGGRNEDARSGWDHVGDPRITDTQNRNGYAADAWTGNSQTDGGHAVNARAGNANAVNANAGTMRRIRVIDDFAHNPDKIAATLRAAALLDSRLVVVFQPHGFGPTRFLREELVDSLAAGTSDRDVIFLPEIFYAGGTTTRDISSRDLVQSIAARGRDARYGESKEAILKPLVEETRPGDTVVVMGGRDDTLTAFCRKILQLLEEKYANCAIL
jgi:UDP-N-acetylmuramate-alanine ligase